MHLLAEEQAVVEFVGFVAVEFGGLEGVVVVAGTLAGGTSVDEPVVVLEASMVVHNRMGFVAAGIGEPEASHLVVDNPGKGLAHTAADGLLGHRKDLVIRMLETAVEPVLVAVELRKFGDCTDCFLEGLWGDQRKKFEKERSHMT